MQYQTVKDLDDFIKQEKRMERRYACILLGVMIACFAAGILIGMKWGM